MGTDKGAREVDNADLLQCLDGLRLDDDFDGDPVLLRPDGSPVDT